MSAGAGAGAAAAAGAGAAAGPDKCAAAGASAGTTMRADASQLRTLQRLQAIMRAQPGRSTEMENLLERWLMAMANYAIAHPAGDGFSLFSWVDDEDDNEDDNEDEDENEAAPALEFNQKLCSELIEKGAAGNPPAAVAVFSKLLAAARGPARGAADGEQVVACADGELVYAEIHPAFEFRRPVDAAAEKLLRIGGCAATIAAALRYALLAPGGQQWGLPQRHVDELYAEYGVRNEAFASPFNSRLVGKPDARFCSLFLDTDTVFGSLGSFFALERLPPGNWVVNPPFIVDLLDRAADKCIRHLDEGADESLTFYFIMPAWTDCAAYTALHQSRYRRAELHLRPGRYVYEAPDGTVVHTRAASIYFALSRSAHGKFAKALHTMLRR